MKGIFCLIICVLVSCSNAEINKSELDASSPTVMQISGIQKDSLSAKQVNRIKSFYAILEEVCESSLEEMISDFEKDPNADVEIAIWTRIAGAYKKCINAGSSKLKLEAKKEIFQLMLNRSMTTDEEAVKSVQPKLLTKKEIEQVLYFYNKEPDPFDGLEK